MKIDYVLLGLIRINPNSSGYQLRGIINNSTGYFFTAHLSQIYPALRKMLDNGWLKVELLPQDGKPDAKLYSILPKGEEALDAWLNEPFKFGMGRSTSDEYITKLMFMGHMPNDKLLAYIDAGIKHFEKERREILESNLGPEKESVEWLAPDIRNRYLTIWGNEFDYIVKETQSRIDRLTALKEAILANQEK
ncbi:PadR family transcriptional regulator [Slackia heliotrinireducens]|uniref:PadR family transcriptional regulator n=1 Tax=Slackia heliotrinireducens TaxID=84110 RepID=UPI00331626E5